MKTLEIEIDPDGNFVWPDEPPTDAEKLRHAMVTALQRMDVCDIVGARHTLTHALEEVR